MLVAAPLAPISPAFSATARPCEAALSSSVGNVISFSGLPSKLVSGEDLVLTADIDCPGNYQAVLKGMNLRFVNDQGIATALSPRNAELIGTAGDVKSYRVVVPTAGGALPEGRQVLVSRSLVMQEVLRLPGSRGQTYVSNAKSYNPEQLGLPANVQMTVWHPTYAAPNPQLPWALRSGVKPEVRMPEWGAGAVLEYRWESQYGMLLSTHRDYVPDAGMAEPMVRLVVTGTWPDGTVHERRSDLATVRDDMGGFVDVTLNGEPVPNGGRVTASTNNPESSSGSGWYKVDELGSLSRDPVTRKAYFEPSFADVGLRFQYVVRSRSIGASRIVTVTPAPPPGDLRSGFVHNNVLVDSTSQLTEHLQPGYKLTARNPWLYNSAWPLGTIAYRWFRDGAVIPGATGASYTLTAADAGHVLQGAVATDQTGFTSNEVRTATVRIPLVNLKAATPKLKGAARVGSRLQVTTPGWTSGTTFSYEWLRNGKVLPGYTTSTYTIQPRDHGDVINVRVTGKKTNHTTLKRTAQQTTLINYGRVEPKVPKITGKAKVGKVLKAESGKWASGVTFRYQWYRNAKAIRGATKATHRLTASDRSKKISVSVRGVKPGYMSEARTSSSVLVKR